MKKLLLAVAVATAGLLAAPAALAQTPPHGTGDAPSKCTTSPCTDQDMNVTVTITGQCSAIEVGDLDFGTHPMLNSTVTGGMDLTATTTLDVLCVNKQAFTVELDYGIKPNNTTQRRVINEGSDMMDYNLYSDSAHTRTWGTQASEAGSAVTGTGTGDYVQYTVYGVAHQTSTNPAGTYTDLVTATLTFN